LKNYFYSFEKQIPIFSKRRKDDVLNQTIKAVSHWDKLVTEQEVSKSLVKEVSKNLRLFL
jgi:serine/threonine-protein kinase HipA